METKALTEALEEVQRLMRGEDELDEQGLELLRQLHGQMGTLLQQPSEDRSPEDRETLLDMMREGVDHFEEDHPKLIDVVGRLADALSSMGI